MKLDGRCQEIRLLVSDVDGVMTDGRLVLNNQGVETKSFHIRDGVGVKLWQRAGHRFAMLTARNSHIVQLRAAELNVELVRQGVTEKLAVIRQLADELQLEMQHVAYIGDDLPDLIAVEAVGLGVAVADACDELRKAAHYVTSVNGGSGAVRETVEMILKNQRRWNDLVQKYSGI